MHRQRWHDVRLTLVHHRLNELVNMMMHALASDDWGHSAYTLSFDTMYLIVKLCLLGSPSAMCFFRVVMLERSMLDRQHIRMMLFWQGNLFVDVLDGDVIVVLLDFFVNCSLHIFMLGTCDCLVCNGWRYSLVDGGVMMASFGPNGM